MVMEGIWYTDSNIIESKIIKEKDFTLIKDKVHGDNNKFLNCYECENIA